MTNLSKKLVDEFDSLINEYLTSLNNYTEDDLLKKSDDDSWSLGQMYNHLIRGTEIFHLAKVGECLNSDSNSDKRKKFPGKLVFLIGGFPPRKIKVPPSPQYTPKQPANKKELQDGLTHLKNLFRERVNEISNKPGKGKSEHPALGYLTFVEWIKLINMHFKHHKRQKQRLEDYTKI